jgi:SAM-dependent methyltransferase
MGARLLYRAVAKMRTVTQHEVRCCALANRLVKDKVGLEIGGPSEVFRRKWMPIYNSVHSLDNCDFSQQTTWADHGNGFRFDSHKPAGRNIFCDGSDLSSVPDATYDFVLSSHNLEHFANPVKALKEWQRVTKPEGSLILVVPHYTYTFDHKRTPTSVDHMLHDYDQGTSEADLTHLEEIIAKHDLSLDPGAGSRENFHQRSLANFENRCLHHHVFDTSNTKELLTRIGMTVHAIETAWPFHIFVIASTTQPYISQSKSQSRSMEPTL